MLRHIEIEGSWNVRDLGGYSTRDGGVTRWRSVLRAGNLDQVSPVGQQALIDYGVKTIIDLRDVNEVRDYPDVFAESTLVKYRHLPVVHTDSPVIQVRLDEYYRKYLDTCHANLGMIIGAVAESEPGVLVHCFAGKDRTGIVSALLLSVVGVPDEVVAEDYALTSGRIAHLIEMWRAYAIDHGQDMAMFENAVSSEAETMRATLEHIEHQYGGVAQYLSNCGVTGQQIDRLRTLLLE